MKKLIFLLILASLPLMAQNAQLDADTELMESCYAFWFEGKIPETFEGASPEAAWHQADVCLQKADQEGAIDALIEALPLCRDKEFTALAERIYDLDPSLFDPQVLSDTEVKITVTYIKNKLYDVWAIKAGVPLLKKFEQGFLESLLVQDIKGEGVEALKLGFEVGDRIFSIGGTAVGDWAEYQVEDYIKKSVAHGSSIEVVMIPNGQNNQITKVFHVTHDIETIVDARRLKK